MSTDHEPTLDDQRESMRGQLREQRARVAAQLAPTAGTETHFPRSITMRVLMHRPELLIRLAERIAGNRFADSLSTILGLVQALRATPARVTPRTRFVP